MSVNDQRTHIDLFSGIGGFALAANAAGYDTRVFCEQDDYCTGVLNRHWPGVPVIRDIREFDGSKWRGADLLTGGFPCQGQSYVGKRLGSRDPRWLWKEMYRVICDAAPRYVLAENVPGLITVEGGVLFESVCADLEDAGYEVLTFILPACCKNAPHRRDRVWIVAHASEQRLQGYGGVEGESEERREESGGHSGESCRSGGGTFRESWLIEPNVGRVANGIPKRVDRLKALGNAIVPQVAYEIIRLMDKQD